MKELSTEEKAKAYDRVSKEVKDFFEGRQKMYSDVNQTLEYLFPELKESEDERIRKELLAWLKRTDGQTLPIDRYNAAVAWLEKQGKNNMGISEATKQELEDNLNKALEKETPESCNEFLEKQDSQNPANFAKTCKDEQKPVIEMITPEESLGIDSDTPKDYSSIDPYFIKSADKVKPKFNVGDWITNGKLTCKVLSVTGKSYELHLYNDDYCHFETDIQSVDKDYHLWTVKDAKKGDVLHSTGWHNDCIFIFDGLDNWKFDEPNGGKAVATGYCCLFVSAGKIEFGIQGPDCIEVDTVKPAIKIQRDLLFSKMKEAGWSWNATTKELSQSKEAISEQILGNSAKTCKDEQKPAWSEEDESKIKGIINTLEGLCDSATSDTTKDLYIAKIDWLKSIKCRVQPKQEWSEEDENRINRLIAYFEDKESFTAEDDVVYANWLKSLKERYTWKPSDEQMHYLSWIANVKLGDSVVEQEVSKHLNELLEQLKKLKE